MTRPPPSVPDEESAQNEDAQQDSAAPAERRLDLAVGRTGRDPGGAANLERRRGAAGAGVAAWTGEREGRRACRPRTPRCRQ
jgi:hypothetical protein